MLHIELDSEAENDLNDMENDTYIQFSKHLDKLRKTLEHRKPPAHLKHGLPYHKEEVGQGRIIYDICSDTIYIVRCFTTHKEYEKWYKSL